MMERSGSRIRRWLVGSRAWHKNHGQQSKTVGATNRWSGGDKRGSRVASGMGAHALGALALTVCSGGPRPSQSSSWQWLGASLLAGCNVPHGPARLINPKIFQIYSNVQISKIQILIFPMSKNF